VTVQRTAAAMAVLASVSVLVTLLVWVGVARNPDQVRQAGSAPTPPLEVLRGWDARRAGAWADGDVRALRALYVPGSRTGRRDAAMLRRYVGRGLVVTGLTTQVLEVGRVRREADGLVMDVVDRVSSAEAVGEGARTVLPRDRPSRRRIELRRIGGDWLVAEVRDLAPGASGAG
jgi:hypothetical protein